MMDAIRKLTVLLSSNPIPLSTWRLALSSFLAPGAERRTWSRYVSNWFRMWTPAKWITFFPPLPSTTLPVRVSTTLAWNHPPRALSSKLPRPPQAVTQSSSRTFSFELQPLPHSKPVLRPSSSLLEADWSTEQNGSKVTDVRAMMNAPKKPAAVPKSVTPPLVPAGTWRRSQAVSRRGLLWERIPNSEEKVSAATAA